MTHHHKLTLSRLFIYYGALLAVWALWELFLSPMVLSAPGGWTAAFLRGGVKLAVWLVPFALLIRNDEGSLLLPFRSMILGRKKWFWALPALLFIVVYYLIGSYVTFGKIAIHPDFRPQSLIGTVLLAGIIEELVFRGFFLNAFANRMSREKAVALTAPLFLVIHFPVWFTAGMFADPLSLFRNSIGILMLSVLFSLLFLRSKNLFVPTVAHMLWNLGAVLLFGG